MSFVIESTTSDVGTVTIVGLHPRKGVEAEIKLPLIVDNTRFPGGIDEENAGSFPPKQVIGDWKDSDHEVLSFANQNSWAGGGQLYESEETQDVDRYAEIATLETRFPKSLMLLPLVQELEGPDGVASVRVLPDMVVSSVKTSFVCFGAKIHALDGTFPNVTVVDPEIDTLDNVMIDYGEAVLFRQSGTTKMYIPQGPNGYQVFDGTALAAAVTTIEPQGFVVFSNKIWAVSVEGVLWKSLDGINWVEVAQVDPGYDVRKIISFYDRSDAPAPHIITDAMTFAFDEQVPALYETELNWAPHPYAGVAVEKWRTDLYAAIGMGIQRYTRGTVNAAGLDRDDGAGKDYTGYVSTLERGFNDLFAGVSSTLVAGEIPAETEVDQGWEVYLGASITYCSVMRLTGGQSWHTLWKAPRSGGTVTDLTVSTARLQYNLMWGWQGRLYISALSVGFDNPMENPTALFQPEGELLSSWFDFGMKVSQKTMASFELKAGRNVSALNTVELLYQIDDEDKTNTWHTMGLLTSPGERFELRLGADGIFPTEQLITTRYNGLPLQRIRYKLRMARDPDDTTQSPELENVIMVFVKNSRRLRNWTFTVNCEVPENGVIYGLSNAERRQFLKGLTDKGGFVPLLVNREWVMVKVAYANGPTFPANEQRGNVTLSCLEAWEMPQEALDT